MSTSLLTSSSTISLSSPLVSEKPGATFKFLFILLSCLLALIIGFILSLILVTQFLQIPTRPPPSSGSFSTVSDHNAKQNNHLFDQFDSISVDSLDFQIDICEDFYHFVCREWLIHHPLSPLEFKRSWLTERSQDIRENFARMLANASDTHAYHHQLESEKNRAEQVTSEPDIDDTSTKNE